MITQSCYPIISYPTLPYPTLPYPTLPSLPPTHLQQESAGPLRLEHRGALRVLVRQLRQRDRVQAVDGRVLGLRGWNTPDVLAQAAPPPEGLPSPTGRPNMETRAPHACSLAQMHKLMAVISLPLGFY